jgi:type I restriction enzyme M protein
MPGNHNDIEKRLWDAADQLRANSQLRSSEYSVPVLGLIFLRYADYKFGIAHEQIEKQKTGSRRSVSKVDYQAKGVLYLPETSRFDYLLNLPEGKDIGRAVSEAMKQIEAENEELKDVLPKTYNRLEKDVLIALIKTLSSIPMDVEGDMFGKIYEYFLGKFAMAEGQRGGEFFTPISIVKLIVEVIEPYHGKIYDPACGSGGMFVQSGKFVERHKENPSTEISIYGQEKTAETIRLCKMNLAVSGLSGDIRQGNTYYEDIHNSLGKFDFVMANPPFNVTGVDKEKIKEDRRFSYGIPRLDNGNYLWIQIFLNALSGKGRAGFVMANSASDARQSELEIRKKLIEAKIVDVMIAIGTNFFYTVTLPCTLWFFDKGKRNASYEDKVLFIDARHIYKQIDRAHREFTPSQIGFIGNIVRFYRGEKIGKASGSDELIKEHFPEGKYKDIPGLCKAATIKEIVEQGYSLNPGRYVGVREGEAEDFDFEERLETLNEELEKLNIEATGLQARIAENITTILGRKEV